MNRAVTDVYEPGSVNKVITAAAAVRRARSCRCPSVRGARPAQGLRRHDPRRRDAPHRAHDAGRHHLAVEQHRRHQVADPLGNERFYQTSRVRVWSPTGVGFPGESAGILPPVDPWSGVSLATMAFGQGIAVTPLQMASVYATIANGGDVGAAAPRAGDGGCRRRFQAAPASKTRRVVSATTARLVTRMLAYAVQAGTGVRRADPRVLGGRQDGDGAGKADRAGYTRYIASFIGFPPASRPAGRDRGDPRRSLTIYGGVAAAPLFQTWLGSRSCGSGSAPARPSRSAAPGWVNRVMTFAAVRALSRAPGALRPSPRFGSPTSPRPSGCPRARRRRPTFPFAPTSRTGSRACDPGRCSSVSPATTWTGTTSRRQAEDAGAGAVVVERRLPVACAAGRRPLGPRGDGSHVRGVLRPARRALPVRRRHRYERQDDHHVPPRVDRSARPAWRRASSARPGSAIDGRAVPSRPHHARGARPPAAAGAHANDRRTRRRHGGLVARPRPSTGSTGSRRRRSVHEPVPGPSRLPRNDGGLLRGEAACCSPRRPRATGP